jgi:hypothetical protein
MTYEIDKVRNNAQPLQYQSNDSLLHTLFIDKKSLIKLDYDIYLQVSKETEIELPKRRKFSEVIGQAVTDKDLVHIYHANRRKNEFAILEINPQSNTAELLEIDLVLKKQTFLHGLTYKSQFYILSIDLDAQLILYEFKGTEYTSSSFDASHLKYAPDEMAYTYLINKALKSGSQGSIGVSQLEILEENLPNSIELVSTEGKLIQRDDKLYLIVDLDDRRTDVIEISLTDKTMNITSFDQPYEDFDLTGTVKSNSYLHEDKLYQVMVSQDKMIMSIKDFASKQEIKRFEVYRNDEEISFSNTVITQLGGAYEDYRELSKTKQLLRKMVHSFPGISVHKLDNQLEITVGGSKEVQGDIGSALILGALSGAVIAGGGGSYMEIGYNPYFNSYVSGINSKSVYIIGLFNEDLNHMIGEVRTNIWDNIDGFANYLDPYQEDITLYKGDIYYSYYNRDSSTYHLVRF